MRTMQRQSISKQRAYEIDIAAKQIIPAVVKIYKKELADTVLAVKEAGADASVQAEMLADISGLLTENKGCP